MILEKLQSIMPQRLLDIGCGCGDFTKEISPYCKQITGIDKYEVIVERARNQNPQPKYLMQNIKTII